MRSVLVTAIPLPHTSRYYLQNVEPEASAIEAAMPADAEVLVNISVDEFSRQIDGRKIWFSSDMGTHNSLAKLFLRLLLLIQAT